MHIGIARMLVHYAGIRTVQANLLEPGVGTRRRTDSFLTAVVWAPKVPPGLSNPNADILHPITRLISVCFVFFCAVCVTLSNYFGIIFFYGLSLRYIYLGPSSRSPFAFFS